MSDTYTKLFRSITASTIVSEPVATRWLWVTMLSQADGEGCVWGSVPGLARLANITLPECEAALECFFSPDPYSRTQAFQGRRIEAIDGGWKLLNYAKYDGIRSTAERAEYKREWDRAHRPSGHQRTGKQSDQSDASPNESDKSGSQSHSPSALLTSHSSVKKQKQKQGAHSRPELPDWLPESLWDDWHRFRNARKGWTDRARELSLRTLTTLRRDGCDPRAVVEQSIERGWTGLFPVKPGDSHEHSADRGGSRNLSAIERVQDRIDKRERGREPIAGELVRRAG